MQLIADSSHLDRVSDCDSAIDLLASTSVIGRVGHFSKDALAQGRVPRRYLRFGCGQTSGMGFPAPQMSNSIGFRVPIPLPSPLAYATPGSIAGSVPTLDWKVNETIAVLSSASNRNALANAHRGAVKDRIGGRVLNAHDPQVASARD